MGGGGNSINTQVACFAGDDAVTQATPPPPAMDTSGPSGCSPSMSADGRALLPFAQPVNLAIVSQVRAAHNQPPKEEVTLIGQKVPLWRLYNEFSSRGGYAAAVGLPVRSEPVPDLQAVG